MANEMRDRRAAAWDMCSHTPSWARLGEGRVRLLPLAESRGPGHEQPWPVLKDRPGNNCFACCSPVQLRKASPNVCHNEAI